MNFSVIERDGTRVVEGQPDEACMQSVRDATRVLEACFSANTRAALLYPENLTPRFFDLSSREAGEVLQKLVGYHVRLAIVSPAGQIAFSSLFGQFLAHEQQAGHLGVFETRDAALAWLTEPGRSARVSPAGA